MKDVRVWFKKTGSAKYISHLDLNRCMTRALKRSKLPLWYTQGFSPRLFLSFASPLSLGFCGTAECMDIRTLQDTSRKEMIERINAGLPWDIRVYAITDPVHKSAEIIYGEYDIFYSDCSLDALQHGLDTLAAQETVMVRKHSKKGEVLFDLKPFFADITWQREADKIHVHAVLPAGSNGGVNPSLLLQAVTALTGESPFVETTRTGFLLEDKTAFA